MVESVVPLVSDCDLHFTASSRWAALLFAWVAYHAARDSYTILCILYHLAVR